MKQNNNNTPTNTILTAEKEKIHKVKSAVLFLNKRKIHHVQNNQGRLVLKLTIKGESRWEW